MLLRAAPLLLLAFLAAGCGERSEPIGGGVSAYPVTVRGADGQEVVLAGAPERIVVLDRGAAELLDELGAGDRVAGVFPARADIEAVRRLEPDLIVAAESDDLSRAEAAARETDAALYVQPDQSVRDVRRGMLELGSLVGEPVRARQLAASLRADAGRVEQAVSGLAPIRVFVDTGLFVPPPDQSLLADLVRRAGGESVAEPEEGEALDACDVLRLGAEVILRVLEPGDPPAEAAFRRCGAARQGVRIVELEAALVDRPGPRTGEALVEIARALHPDAFP